MPVSLLESIFGKDDSATSTSASLFDAPLVVPEQRIDDKKADDDDEGDDDDEEEEEEDTGSGDTDEEDNNSSLNKDNEEETRSSKKADSQEKPPEESDGSRAAAATSSHDEPVPNELQVTEEETRRTIFVGNLPHSMTRNRLRSLFADVGPVSSTRLRSLPIKPDAGVKLPPEWAGRQNLVRKICAHLPDKLDTSLKSSILGYVVFKDEESVAAALSKNNTLVEGRHICVNVCTPPNCRERALRSVFLGNLPHRETDEETLRELCATVCVCDPNTDIEQVRVVRDNVTHECRGIAYIIFRSPELVPTALRNLQGQEYEGRKIRVRVCSKRFNNKHASHANLPYTIRSGARTEAALRTASYKGNVDKKRKRDGGSSDHGNGKKKLATAGASELSALRGMILSQGTGGSSKKLRRGKKKSEIPGRPSGVSRKAAHEAKTNKRVKKLEKRLQKGMGKLRKQRETA